MRDSNAGSGAAAFGPYQFVLTTRQLLREGEPVLLGGRASDLLFALIERRGEVVSKQELIAYAWPNLFVEEANLRVQLAALRRALGDGRDQQRFIVNVAGRGYSFVAAVEFLEEPDALPLGIEDTKRHNLPNSLVAVIGRERDLALIESSIPKSRLITLVGPGGVGKTTTALEAARAQLPRCDGVILVELAGISDPSNVASDIASAVRRTLGVDYRSLSDRFPIERGLLVLDNCEHVISAAAVAIEILLRSSVALKIIATSREPLRAEGERVIRLSGLDVAVPSDDRKALADFPLSAAVRLFIDRVGAVLGAYEPEPIEVSAIAELCQRLDGNPLAIELAAGRADTFGVLGLMQRLDDVFRLLVAGRRTALGRHQTLQATLDWSFAQLMPSEQQTLSRLSVFAGHFSLEAASQVASFDLPTWETIDAISSLVSKSLVSADFSNSLPRYRLLEITRAYAAQKLTERGELGRVQKRHALYMKEAMALAETSWPNTPPSVWRAIYGSEVDNLRLALNWCFSSLGDPELGVELTVRSALVWFQLSLVAEGCHYFQRAAAASETRVDENPENAVTLLTSLGTALLFTLGPGPEACGPLYLALEIAQQSNDTGLRLRALFNAWMGEFATARYEQSLSTARELSKLSSAGQADADRSARAIADRLIGASHLHLGNASESRNAFLLAISTDAASAMVRMQFDHKLLSRAWCAMATWLVGMAEQATTMATSCLADARELGHAPSLSLVLVESVCPISLLEGRMDDLEGYVDLLQSVTTDYPFGPWRAWGECFRGSLYLGRGQLQAASEQLERGLAMLSKTRWVTHRALFLSQLTQAHSGLGREEAARAAIEEALDLSRRTGDVLILPEVLRTKAELLCQSAPNEAKKCLGEAVELASNGDMIAWLRRCAVTSAMLPEAVAQAT